MKLELKKFQFCITTKNLLKSLYKREQVPLLKLGKAGAFNNEKWREICKLHP